MDIRDRTFLFLVALGLAAPAPAQFSAFTYVAASSATVTYMQLQPTTAPTPAAGTLYYDSTNNVVWLSTAANSSSWVVIAPYGVYLGLTPSTYTGNLGGANGAAALCSLTWPQSRMCTVEEVMTLPGPLPAAIGWAGTEGQRPGCCGKLKSVTSG